MAFFSVSDIHIKGLAVTVPSHTEDNNDLSILAEKERELFIRTVGIRYRKVAPKGITASDLCFASADKLLNELHWDRADIQVLVFITQTPDYIIPNTSSTLQHKLGLSKNCLVFDVNLGCSGYVYGLSIISSMLQNIPNGKALLLVGDVSTSTISKKDRSTTPLFSDAGSATALEHSAGGKMIFNLQTDGKEFDDIIVPEGGFRNRATVDSFVTKEIEKGVHRSGLDMKLDGAKIFNFALREIAPNIKYLLAEAAVTLEEIDYFVFHQANLLMLESLRKKLSIKPEKMPFSLYDFGNTSSASIPLTMLARLPESLREKKLKLLLSGFGVGLSWGTVFLETNSVICLPIMEI